MNSELERLELENRKLRKINVVLMDRVERDMDAQAGNAYSLFRTAITLETKISERTNELTKLTQQLQHEIAVRRQTEEALRVAKAEAEQANAGKTRFLAAASHDLMQPLNAARLFVGALAEEVTSERGRDVVGRIVAALGTVGELIEALVYISRLDTGAWTVDAVDFELGPMLARLAGEYEVQCKAAGLRLIAVPTRCIVHTDRQLLERMLRNLISNAIRYTASGRVLIGCRRRRGHVSVQVWDTGIGIPEDKLGTIFGEFQQVAEAPRRDSAGLGLGLAIVDRIARLLSLRIDVRSKVGQGSCFAVEVPCGGVSAQSVIEKGTGVELSGRCVVVIDDDEPSLLSMCTLLHEWGCVPIAGPDAGSAVAAVERSGRRPDLVIADYYLRDGAVGTAAVARLRARYGVRLPALIVSADRSALLRREVSALNLAFLPKPASPGRVRAMLSYLLAETGNG
jgi:two-component system, sensor histidine kinase